jgi:hypothetical protein
MRWLTLLVMALALIVPGCGAEGTAEEPTTNESTDEGTDLSSALALDCPVFAYVGWSIWQAPSYAVEGGNKIPEKIKRDVETLARALVTQAARFEDLFPPEDLGIPPGDSPLDNELARFGAAIGSLDEEELAPALQRLEAWAQRNCTG